MPIFAPFGFVKQPPFRFDEDALAFLNAAGITDNTQKLAVNQLVLDLKAAAIWDDIIALWPFVGGTATTHKYNLKDPRDLDAAYRLTFNGTLTHSSTGVKGDGSTGYYNTHINALSTLTRDSNTGFVYTTVPTPEDKISGYAYIPSGAEGWWQLGGTRNTAGNYQIRNMAVNAQSDSLTSPSAAGFFASTRRNSTQAVMSINDVHTTVAQPATTAQSLNIYGLAFNSQGTSATFPSANEHAAGGFFSKGLSDTELDDLYDAITSYQLALGRLDSDAAAFISAAGITDTTTQIALNNLVLGMKGIGAWDESDAIYPFVGGNATAHSYNLKDTSTYQITWNGTVTHDSNGITGNGTTGYGNTGWNQTTAGRNTDGHISIYSRTNFNSTSGLMSDMGAGVSPAESLMALANSGTSYWIYNSAVRSAAYGNTQGHYLTNRGASATAGWKNGSSISSGANGSGYPNVNLTIAAQNRNGSIERFTTRNYAFASMGAEISNPALYYTVVQNFQTALGRQV